MKNPPKSLFCQKSGYFHENPPIETQNLTHKIPMKINFFLKNLKIRARFARTGITIFFGRAPPAHKKVSKFSGLAAAHRHIKKHFLTGPESFRSKSQRLELFPKSES